MDAKSLWSGGVQWGTATTARANAYWQDDGATPTGKPFVDVAVDGVLLTDSTMSATWNLGISDFIADLSPNTAQATFKGQVSAAQGDDFVISTGWGPMWSGRVDTIADTRDVNGNHWTTVTATDRLAALGAATLADYTITYDTVVEVAAQIARDLGVPVTVTDDSATPVLPILTGPAGYVGSALEFINGTAKATNVMLAMKRDGSITAVKRESVTPSGAVSLTGSSAPVNWTSLLSIDVDINRWSMTIDPGTTSAPFTQDLADINQYGLREYVAPDGFAISFGTANTEYNDWAVVYGGSQRPTVQADFVVSDFSQSDLLQLDPMDWVTESGTDWQVMSLQWSLDGPGEPLRLSITADNLLALL